MALIRLRRLIAEDMPVIPTYDEPEWARRLDYDRPVASSLAVLRAVRGASLQLLQSLDEGEWARSGTLPSPGPTRSPTGCASTPHTVMTTPARSFALVAVRTDLAFRPMTNLVFIHGTRLTASMWTAQLAALGTEFQAVAVDLPGHGERADETFTLDRAIDVVGETIDGLPSGRAVVVGLSLGGYVAMALAATSPTRVQGLVLSGATAEPVGWRELSLRAVASLMDAIDGPRLDRAQERYYRSRYPAEIAEPIIEGGFWMRGGAEALRALAGERFLSRLAAYPGRTQILNGEYDLVFRPGAPRFAAAARDASRVRLRGATHMANLDRPAAFNAAVRRFARSLTEGAGVPETGAASDHGKVAGSQPGGR
ncbi:MAG: alpha/beta fold hydrolase [Thermomicrobiales bacterium]|nr:MAG: alpha/beta fold hydrolase [Thermomicrobiales bacterium]